MLGLMQDWPLLCHRIIDHAAVNHGERPVISRSVEGPFHHTNYAEVRARALRVAQRLERDGIKLGDRVATLAGNTWALGRQGFLFARNARSPQRCTDKSDESFVSSRNTSDGETPA